MCDSIQNIIQEYNQRLQNTWHPAESKQGGIPCPSQKLKDFFVEFIIIKKCLKKAIKKQCFL